MPGEADRITDGQRDLLTGFIARSNDAAGFTKRLICFLLQHTDNLSCPCSITVPPDAREGETRLAEQVHSDLDRMISSGRSTHLEELLGLTGTPMIVSRIYDATTGCRVWVSREMYGVDEVVREVPFTIETIRAIQVPKH